MKCDVNCKFYPMCWNVGEGICEVGEDCDRYEPERPHGEWIPQDEFEAYNKCSNCGIVIDNDFPIWRNFCPNCGASMLKEGEAE